MRERFALLPPNTVAIRTLTDDELWHVWRAADADGWPFGVLVKLLILTGQRRDEVSGMRWSEINLGAAVWTIPKTRAKNDIEHEVPLQPRPRFQSIKLYTRTSSAADLVFTTNGTNAVSGFSRAKRRLDKAIAKQARQPLAPWVLHDLRRTVATGLQRLGVRLEVTEAVLNHISGSRSGIVGVYQRHDYRAEKAQALQVWSTHVMSVVKKKKTSAERPLISGDTVGEIVSPTWGR